MAKRVYENSWFYRRTAALATMGFCKIGMGYCLWKGLDNALFRDAFTTLALLDGATINGYMGWSFADDRSVVNKLGKDAFRRDDVPEGWPVDIAPPEKIEGQP